MPSELLTVEQFADVVVVVVECEQTLLQNAVATVVGDNISNWQILIGMIAANGKIILDGLSAKETESRAFERGEREMA